MSSRTAVITSRARTMTLKYCPRVRDRSRQTGPPREAMPSTGRYPELRVAPLSNRSVRPLVGDLCRRRGLLAILGVMVRILVVGVFVLGIAVDARLMAASLLAGTRDANRQPALVRGSATGKRSPSSITSTWWPPCPDGGRAGVTVRIRGRCASSLSGMRRSSAPPPSGPAAAGRRLGREDGDPVGAAGHAPFAERQTVSRVDRAE